MAKWGETHKKSKSKSNEAKNVPELAGSLQRVSERDATQA
jgi:hypothetical protein